MKKLFMLLFPIAVYAQEGIQFRDLSWQSALAEAKQTNKLIFLDAYATWCGPCKTLEKYTFTDDSVGKLFNERFVNVRLDMEKYPGLELAEKYKVNLYPTLLFINGEGELVHRGCGAVEAAELIQLGKDALVPVRTLKGMNATYAAGERSVDFMYEYLTLQANSCLDVDAFLENHFANVKDDQLTDDSNWFLINNYVTDLYSREFQYLLKNQPIFEAKIDPQEVQDNIFETFMINYEFLSEIEGVGSFGIKSLIYLAQQHEFKRKAELMALLNFGLGELTEDWALYAKGATSFIKPEKEDQDFLLDVSWKFYLFVEDKEHLYKALSWTKYVLDTYEPEPSSIDTYASLLYKLGRKVDALKFEKQALELAKSWGEDLTHYEHQLAKFNR